MMADNPTDLSFRLYPDDFSRGYPADPTFFFRCLACGEFVCSIPKQNHSCSCKNVRIDCDAGRISIESNDKAVVYQLI
jgi:hypothetical protein